MANYRLQARLQWDSGLPEDVSVNVWHCTATNDAGAAEFAADIIDFYQSVDGAFANIVNVGSVHSIKVYDLADPEPRAPVSTHTFNLADATGSPLPPEAAICLSFQGDQVSGEPQARRRGRVFLGPLDLSTVNAAGAVDVATTDLIRDAANVLLAASIASSNYQWAVYSRVDDLMVVITNGWVDNAFDVQRRRGLPASARDTFIGV